VDHAGYYGFARVEVASVMRHLLEQAHITVEDRDAVERALSSFEVGIDFADALHHASYPSCDSVALGQREAAEIFGGGVNAFSRYENGKTKPPLALVKLLKVLDRHPDLLDEIKTV
jgi:HTH-type transcriptional regulator/antitoxin MqsA